MNDTFFSRHEYVIGSVFTGIAIVFTLGVAFLVLRLIFRASFPRKNNTLTVCYALLFSFAMFGCSQLPDVIAPKTPSSSKSQNYVLPEVEITGTNYGAGERGISEIQQPQYKMGPDGAGSGGGGGTEPRFTRIPYVPAEVMPFTPNLGNYGITLRIKDMVFQVIEARLEVDTNTHQIQSLTLSLGGITYLAVLTTNGVGVQTAYNPVSDTYYFNISFTKTYGGAVSNTRTLYGRLCPSKNTGSLYFE